MENNCRKFDFFCQPIRQDWQISIAFTLIIIFLLLITIITFFYLFKTWKYSTLYPIEQLSPKITILQGLSLYIFVLDTSIIILLYTTGIIQPIKSDEPDYSHFLNDLPLYFDTFIFLFSRGLFFILTIFKTLRVYIAQRGRKLQTTTYCVKLFMDEFALIKISLLITFIIWPTLIVVYILYTHQPVQEVLLIFEQRNYYSISINLFEELVVIFLLFIIPNKYNRSDQIHGLLLKPIQIYVIWFTLNSLSLYVCSDLEDNLKDITYSTLTVWVSCILRAVVAFYFTIIIPYNMRNIQIPYMPEFIVSQFDYFVEQQLCVKVFYQYLKHLDSINLQDRNIQSESSYNYVQQFEQWLELRMEREQKECSLRTQSQIQKYLNLKQNSESFCNDEQKLEQTIKTIFQDRFLYTNAADNLLKAYQKNQIINANFYTLKLQSNFILVCQQNN